MSAAAVILLAVAKIDGEISKEEKDAILQVFLTDFHLSDEQARGLLVSTSFLIKDEMSLLGQAASILERSLARFTKDQVDSFLAMLRKVADIEAGSQDKKAALIAEVSAVFQPENKNDSTW